MRRFTVPGWPATVPGHAAVVPHLNRLAGSGAQQFKDGVTGLPGTAAIPVRPRDSVPSQAVADIAQMGLSRSSDAPDVFYPNLYWARPQGQFWPGAGMPVSVQSDNLMPVPAVDPRGIPATLANPLQIRGQAQIQQLPNLPAWPNVTG